MKFSERSKGKPFTIIHNERTVYFNDGESEWTVDPDSYRGNYDELIELIEELKED